MPKIIEYVWTPDNEWLRPATDRIHGELASLPLLDWEYEEDRPIIVHVINHQPIRRTVEPAWKGEEITTVSMPTADYRPTAQQSSAWARFAASFTTRVLAKGKDGDLDGG